MKSKDIDRRIDGAEMMISKSLSWEETLSAQELQTILQLEDGDVFETKENVAWMRFVGCDLREMEGILEDEFKVSPHGSQQPDLESEWVDRERLVKRLQEMKS